MREVENVLERLLWHSRLLILVAVIASLVGAVLILYLVTVDVVQLGGQVLVYGGNGISLGVRAEMRKDVFGQIVNIIDGYLLAGIMIIFALGLYELFISKINAAEKSEFAARLLLIRNLDDLKDRLAKVVLLMLVVKFFQYALQLQFVSALELLYLALGVALIGLALYLSGQRAH